MNENVKEKLSRYRQGLPPAQPKKKISSLIILINLVILAILFFANRKTSVKNTSSFDLEYENIEYNITIDKDIKTENQSISVKLKSLGTGTRALFYKDSVINAIFKSEGEVVARLMIGNNNSRFSINPQEVKIFEENISNRIIKDYAEHHPQALNPKKRSIFFRSSQYLPITAQFIINTEKPVSIFLDLKFDIE